MIDQSIDKRLPKIAVIGGGTGSFTLLKDLKEFTPKLTAIVNMSDDGGSTGRLRDELGILPPGDIRQCLVALSDTPEVRDIFSYRFGQGSLAGQSVGNIILSGLELQLGSFAKAVEVASKVLHIKGKVVPVTLTNHTLVMQDGENEVISEVKIASHIIKNRSPQIKLRPNSPINPQARVAIQEADLIVIAPGNLYASLLPVFAVDGVKEALTKTSARVIVISNLVTKPGQTDGWHVVDYIKEYEKYIGQGRVDVVMYNTEAPSIELLDKYAADGEFPVASDVNRFSEVQAIPIGVNLLDSKIVKQDSNDKAIKRTLIRHNGYEVSRQLMDIYFNKKS